MLQAIPADHELEHPARVQERVRGAVHGVPVAVRARGAGGRAVHAPRARAAARAAAVAAPSGTQLNADTQNTQHLTAQIAEW